MLPNVPKESAPARPKNAPAPLLPRLDLSKVKWAAAGCRVPALVGCLLAVIPLHQAAGGVVAAGAALSVGLVGNRRINGSPMLAMAATSLIMAFSASAGTLVGGSPWGCPLVTALWGLGFAFLTIHDEDLGWMAMQGVICLVIAEGFPGQGDAALVRALAVGFGGVAQIGFLGLVELVRVRLPWRIRDLDIEGEPAPVRAYSWKQLFASMSSFSTGWAYAARVSLTMIVAVEGARALHLQNGYWLPMTTVIILKPDFYRTYSGAIQRVAGTLLGVTIASLIAHLFHPTLTWLLVLVALFAYPCFAFLKINPILFSAALTAYVVFLIATTGLPETTITGHRVVLTALGSALALSSRMLGRKTIISLFRGQLKTFPDFRGTDRSGLAYRLHDNLERATGTPRCRGPSFHR
jgi:hypothetical protein